MFQVLRDNKLFINLKKSELFLKEIQFLGHIIFELETHMDLENLEVIKAWPLPRGIHDLRSFIGMFPYYKQLYT